MQSIKPAHRKCRRPALGKIGLHRGEGTLEHRAQIAEIAHAHLDLFVAGLEQTIARAVLGAAFEIASGLCADILEGACIGIPVVDADLKPVDLLDVVLVGNLRDITQHVASQADALDANLELRNVEPALGYRFLTERDGFHGAAYWIGGIVRKRPTSIRRGSSMSF